MIRAPASVWSSHLIWSSPRELQEHQSSNTFLSSNILLLIDLTVDFYSGCASLQLSLYDRVHQSDKWGVEVRKNPLSFFSFFSFCLCGGKILSGLHFYACVLLCLLSVTVQRYCWLLHFIVHIYFGSAKPFFKHPDKGHVSECYSAVASAFLSLLWSETHQLVIGGVGVVVGVRLGDAHGHTVGKNGKQDENIKRLKDCS